MLGRQSNVPTASLKPSSMEPEDHHLPILEINNLNVRCFSLGQYNVCYTSHQPLWIQNIMAFHNPPACHSLYIAQVLGDNNYVIDSKGQGVV